LFLIYHAIHFASSASDARRFISQGAVRINGEKTDELKLAGLRSGDVIQSGRLKSGRIRIYE
jgi:ribosomal protein S4